MVKLFTPGQVYLVYNPGTNLGKRTHALALSVNSVVHEIDAASKTITRLHWKELLDMIGCSAADLLSHDHPDFKSVVKNDSYSEADWLEILTHNPQLLKGPIAVYHKKAVLCTDPKDILQLEEAWEAQLNRS
ncbi:MAG: hypothetical protein K1X47_17110 [Cyclobacteriaceae bacterium]|nr:hypothetical protein [Cyclobacteriaceae bacterium]